MAWGLQALKMKQESLPFDGVQLTIMSTVLSNKGMIQNMRKYQTAWKILWTLEKNIFCKTNLREVTFSKHIVECEGYCIKSYLFVSLNHFFNPQGLWNKKEKQMDTTSEKKTNKQWDWWSNSRNIIWLSWSLLFPDSRLFCPINLSFKNLPHCWPADWSDEVTSCLDTTLENHFCVLLTSKWIKDC